MRSAFSPSVGAQGVVGQLSRDWVSCDGNGAQCERNSERLRMPGKPTLLRRYVAVLGLVTGSSMADVVVALGRFL